MSSITIEQVKGVLESIKQEVGKVIVGQEEVIDRAIIVILMGQHGLIEGVPGVAKTLLVRTLARVLGCDFSRIQFTPDLMPADITGTSVFNLQQNEFSLLPGPIFTTFLLADEINRAPAKTQSALLQAMQERHVSIDRHTYDLGANFTVFATQNPVEYEGTYPLAEAQKDRFALKIQMPFPERDAELLLAKRMLGSDSPENSLNQVGPVITQEQLNQVRVALQGLVVREEVLSYMLDIVRATRTHEAVLVGAGPRATQSLILASRAAAAVYGHDFVSPDDVRMMFKPVLEHRIILRPEYEIEGTTINEVMDQIVQTIPVPR